VEDPQEENGQQKPLSREERCSIAVDALYAQHGYVAEDGEPVKEKVADVLFASVSKAIVSKPAEREKMMIPRTRLVELAFPGVPGRADWHEQEDPELAEDVYKELMRRTWTICSENPKGPLQSRLNGDVGLVLVQYMPSQHGVEGGVYVTRDYKSLNVDVLIPAKKKQEAFARRQAAIAEMLMDRVPEHAKKFKREYVSGLQTGANIAKELIAAKLASLEANNNGEGGQ
jgi:hypothetical protein